VCWIVNVEVNLSANEKIPLVYACSGASSAAQMANHIAVKLDRLKLAEMSCIAGVGGDVRPLVKTAKSGRPIIALDGCPLQCTAKILLRHGLHPDKHLDLSTLGVQKRKHEDFDPQEAAQVLQQLLNAPDFPGRTDDHVTPTPSSSLEASSDIPECSRPPCFLPKVTEPDSSSNSAR
jgi:uncharacterized metal-binding protein